MHLKEKKHYSFSVASHRGRARHKCLDLITGRVFWADWLWIVWTWSTRNLCVRCVNWSCYIRTNWYAVEPLLADGASIGDYPIGKLSLSFTETLTSVFLSEPFTCPFCHEEQVRKKVDSIAVFSSHYWHFHTNWQTFADRAVEKELNALPIQCYACFWNGSYHDYLVGAPLRSDNARLYSCAYFEDTSRPAAFDIRMRRLPCAFLIDQRTRRASSGAMWL